jgi:hypothetical protein
MTIFFGVSFTITLWTNELWVSRVIYEECMLQEQHRTLHIYTNDAIMASVSNKKIRMSGFNPENEALVFASSLPILISCC